MRYIVLLVLLSCSLTHSAQTPKWAEKAKRAVVRIATYSADSTQIGEGTAFFIDENGTTLSPLDLFKGAAFATATDYQGQEAPVDLIMGVNDLYNIIKVQIATPKGKKRFPLLLGKHSSGKNNKASIAVNQNLYAISFSPAKALHVAICRIEEISHTNGIDYFMLQVASDSIKEGTPMLNEVGELVGVFQAATGGDTSKGYALSAQYASSLSISALSLGSSLLNSIGIPKDIPTKRDDALAMVYLAQTSTRIDDERLQDLLSRFIARFPRDVEGYKLRSSYLTSTFSDEARLTAAEEDIKQVFKLTKAKDEAYYHLSQCILNYAVRQDTTITQHYKGWTYEQAQIEIGKAIEINPLPLYLQHQANLYSLQRKYDLSYAAYQKVNASPLASPSSFYAASRLARLMGDTTSLALSMMDSCIAHFSKPLLQEAAPYLYERAEMYLQADSIAKALADYDAYEALVGGELNALFYYNRSQLSVRLQDRDRALEDIQRALRQLPDNPTLLEEQGSILLTMARYVEAVTSLNLALSQEANRPYALRLKGYAFLQMGQNEEAKTALTAARELGDEIATQLLEHYF